MKYFDPTYYILLMSSLITWLATAKDLMTWSAALVLTILSCFFMYERYRDTKVARKLKEEELKKLTKEDESNNNQNS